MVIREAEYEDLSRLLMLYTYLHENAMPPINDEIQELWSNIINDANHHIIIGVEDDAVICACVLITVLNLTNNQRPYSLIENVITHPGHRNKGFGTRILEYAKKIAIGKKCYKIMLMTGSKDESTLNFYSRAGYNTDDKAAFIQWLDA